MILQGDCIEVMRGLEPEQFHTCVTSPPYWGLRDYGIPPSDWPEMAYTPMPGLPAVTVPAWRGCLGLEPTPEMFIAHSVAVFREVWRLLRPDGTLWLNYGDSYFGTGGDRKESAAGPNSCVGPTADASAPREGRVDRHKHLAKIGLKPKDLIGIPWRVAFALQADGWYLRMDNIWSKPNPMPESVRDRPTKAHEYMFLLSKSERYYYDNQAIKEPGVQDEWANGFRGGSYTEGSTFDNQDGGKRKARGNFKVPAGWDTESGSHGTVHRQGRSKANSFARNVKESPPPGQPAQHRSDREDVEYSGMRNKRSVWTVATQPFPEAHFATFPEKLIEPCIIAGAPPGGKVLDPFGGSGTTLKVSLEQERDCTIIELGEQYIDIARRRTATVQPQMQF
ncbi:site-specific DNA-methyltransferase [Paenibacillus sp. P22]|uniref:DNA-methyltransferase n=1 Tax=Paenibacillus sp. P22 TaxID=483908 RepID=UPI00038FF455|nr:site-specific DNA-methyltransferase [Paenibacillus sp. P22]CDN41669.1 DNA methylase N-4/N-6 domain protein [Paenibacillus sp. P22]